MFTAFADSIPAASETTVTPVQTILSYVVIIAIVLFVIYRKRKKAGKSLPFLNNKKSKVSTGPSVPSTPSGKSKWYGDDPSLMSIAAFQKKVYKRFVVFDLETTGLDDSTDRICEIGAVRVVNGKITDEYQTLVNPKMHIPDEASAKNHITDSMVKKSPTIGDVLPDFLAFVGDDYLAAHNCGFDAAFLRKACSECGLTAPTSFFDTMRLSVYWPGLKNKKLATFLDAAGIENDNAHRALSDARSTALLIVKSFDKIKG